MSDPAHCPFCKIVRGALPAVKVYEDERTLAFMDIRPASPGHLLVISKAHAVDLLEISEADLIAVTQVTQRLARAARQAFAADGIRISQFNGSAAGQTVFHYHVHVVPMWQGQRAAAHGREAVAPEQLEAQAAQLRAALQNAA